MRPVLDDQATDATAFSDAVLVEIDRRGQRFHRRGCVRGAVRPLLIVMGLVIAQNPPQMGLVPDEAAVQELASASPIQRRGVDAGILWISHAVDAATFTPRPASSPWILRYPQPGFFAGQLPGLL
jgi:hypothetical protein